MNIDTIPTTSLLAFAAVGVSYTFLQRLTHPKKIQTKYLPKFAKELIDGTGKVFVITGTTSGTGLAAAQVVAERGGEVVLLNRASKRVDKMMKTLKSAVPDGKFVPIECDLQSFASVRQAAEAIKKRYSKVYCLCNNAGIMATPDRATVDGYDTQMQTNHLSHFLLTAELFPLLEAEAEAGGDARIVNHSSGGRHFPASGGLEEKYFAAGSGGNLGGDELKMMAGPCFERYFQTKLANSVFTYGLDARLRAKHSKVKACDAHPGASDTNLGDHIAGGEGMTAVVMQYVIPLMAQTPEDGAMGILRGMMHPDAVSGDLYGPNDAGALAVGFSGPAVAIPPKPYEIDPRAIEMLWKMSEDATGVKFRIY